MKYVIYPGPSNLWVFDKSSLPMDVIGRAHCVAKDNSTTIETTSKGKVLRGNHTAGVTGAYTNAGAVNYTGKSELSVFYVGSFNSFPSDYSRELVLFRIDRNGTSSEASIAFDLFTDGATMKTRPLISTSGTSGWSTSTDRSVTNTIELKKSYIFFMKWKSGGEILRAYCKVGESGLAFAGASSTYNVSGVVNVTSGGSGSLLQTHFNGSAYNQTPAYSADFDMEMAGIFPYEITEKEANVIALNPNILLGKNSKPIFGNVSNIPYTKLNIV